MSKLLYPELKGILGIRLVVLIDSPVQGMLVMLVGNLVQQGRDLLVDLLEGKVAPVKVGMVVHPVLERMAVQCTLEEGNIVVPLREAQGKEEGAHLDIPLFSPHHHPY